MKSGADRDAGKINVYVSWPLNSRQTSARFPSHSIQISGGQFSKELLPWKQHLVFIKRQRVDMEMGSNKTRAVIAGTCMMYILYVKRSHPQQSHSHKWMIRSCFYFHDPFCLRLHSGDYHESQFKILMYSNCCIVLMQCRQTKLCMCTFLYIQHPCVSGHLRGLVCRRHRRCPAVCRWPGSYFTSSTHTHTHTAPGTFEQCCCIKTSNLCPFTLPWKRGRCQIDWQRLNWCLRPELWFNLDFIRYISVIYYEKTKHVWE